MNTDEKIDQILKDIGDIKLDMAVMAKSNEFYKIEVKEHKKILHGNGWGWGIKSQVRILWALFIGCLGYYGLNLR
ncbi:MAG: hypothetical protein KAJ48_02960 [Elusimicrobiales bacterium]|nr:hypothetical protein [Elusimicrobiales bacterium]